jgi:hypothetical protein
MPTFLGMRGTGDFVANQRPESWDEVILRLFPNGQAPLTAIMAKLGQRPTDDPVFHYFRKVLPTQRIVGTADAFIYTATNLSTKYSATYPTGGAPAGTTLYVKMAAADIAQLKAGHVILFRDQSDYTLDCAGVVTLVTVAGASSYLTVKLIEADDNGGTTGLATCDLVYIIGTAYAEGSGSPTAIAQDVVEDWNQCQIFKDSLEITNTARLTKLRTGDAYQEAKRDALELYSTQREKAYWWGVRFSDTDPTSGKPRRFTGGLIKKIVTNRKDYTLDTDATGQTWLQGGEDWLDNQLEALFRYGSTEKLAFCGSGALLGLNRLAKANGTIMINPMTVAYGLKVGQWVTPFGTLYLKTHPLFSYEPSTRNAIVAIEPKNIERRVMRDTKFETDIQLPDADEKKDQFICEDGLKMDFEQTFAYLNGVGLDNSL